MEPIATAAAPSSPLTEFFFAALDLVADRYDAVRPNVPAGDGDVEDADDAGLAGSNGTGSSSTSLALSATGLVVPAGFTTLLN